MTSHEANTADAKPASAALFRLIYDDILGKPAPVSVDRNSDRRIFHVDADFHRDGAWSGARDLIEQAYLDIRENGDLALIEKNNYALNRILSKHRSQIELKHASLTDIAQGSERTRNYPLDRAYRLVHGLIGLLIEWKLRSAPEQVWTIVAQNFANTQHLGRRFFIELARRGAAHSDIEVLVDAAGDTTALSALRMRAAHSEDTLSNLGLSPIQPRAITDEQRAMIEERLSANRISDWEDHYPALLAYHRARGNELEATKIALRALCINNHYGYYHESSSFTDGVLPYFDMLMGDHETAHWDYIGNLYTGLVTTGREEDALRLVLERADPVLTLSEYRAKMHYLLSMTYLRYLKKPDMALSEAHILMAVECIEAAKGVAKREDYMFLKVFINNGLAFLRVRQGRQAEALELCQSGYALLTRELGEERHMLHRSVLQYNTAQVYAMLNMPDEAISYYRAAIEMDPYYSEYYNEIGNLLQRQEHFAEANAQYDLAIEYSAPYPEVYFNKGVCALNMDQPNEAIACFNFSLELNPLQPELYVLRAELHDDIAHSLADYDAAIALAPDTVVALVNRAVLHYEAGHHLLALSDMDRVIAIDDAEPSHYLNRAEIHKAMEQQELYQRDMAAAEACETAA